MEGSADYAAPDARNDPKNPYSEFRDDLNSLVWKGR